MIYFISWSINVIDGNKDIQMIWNWPNHFISLHHNIPKCVLNMVDFFLFPSGQINWLRYNSTITAAAVNEPWMVRLKNHMIA